MTDQGVGHICEAICYIALFAALAYGCNSCSEVNKIKTKQHWKSSQLECIQCHAVIE